MVRPPAVVPILCARMAPATDLRAAIAANPVWYHSIELAPGLVTPGHIDLRPVARRVLPERMEGRALDIGTFDGFWAFELERRGAQVMAIDAETVDQAQWPPIHRERLEAAARDMEGARTCCCHAGTRARGHEPRSHRDADRAPARLIAAQRGCAAPSGAVASWDWTGLQSVGGEATRSRGAVARPTARSPFAPPRAGPSPQRPRRPRRPRWAGGLRRSVLVGVVLRSRSGLH